MSVSHSLSFGQTGGSTPIGDTVTVVGELATEANVAVNGNATNQEEGIAFPYATLREVYIKSDRTLTLKTNSSSAPDDTITITAGVPLVWHYQSGLANPFTADVTSIFLTNAGATAANVYIRTLAA